MNKYFLPKKGLLSAVLFVLFIIIGLTNAAAQTFTVEDLNYSVNSNGTTVTVTGHVNGTHDTGELIIPSIVTYDDVTYTVTKIDNNAFYGCTGFTALTIGSSVTHIGASAFFNCYGLSSITSYAVTPPMLYTDALHGLMSYIPVNIPVGSLDAYQSASGWNLFSNIYANLAVPISFADPYVKALCVANWDTNNDGELSYSEAAAVTDLGQVFKGNQTITSFNELQYFTGLTSIGVRAFYECTALTALEIPNSVTTIGELAFYRCRGLTAIEIPNSVTSIGEHAFYECTALTALEIPNSVTSIGRKPFEDCNALAQIGVEEGNSNYDSRNNCNAIIETATNKLIVGCKNTVIPNTVTSIGEDAFWGCTGLISIEIPNSVTTIGSDAFRLCTGLTELVIPHSVDSIGSGAFLACYGLTGSLIIPNSVTYIGLAAFGNCPGFTQILVEEGNSNYDSRDNCNAIIETATNILIAGCQTTEIPNYVTRIGTYSFCNCSGLTGNLIIPNSVTSIGSYAFFGCTGLTSITSYAITPPTIETLVFLNINKSIPVYVPAGTVPAYKSAYGWSKFTNIREIGTHWSPISGTENNMIVNGVIVIDGEQQYNPLLEVGAFCGDECRGSSFARYFPPTGEYVVSLTVVSNETEGETISFRLYDHEQNAEADVVSFKTIEFIADGEIGTNGVWYEYVFYRRDNLQNVNFVEGWNWWSTYIEQNSYNGLEILEDSLGHKGSVIKNQTQALVNYYPQYGNEDVWFGDMTALENEKCYLVKTTSECEFLYTGIMAIPSEHPITLTPNWTWIGYSVNIEQYMATATDGFAPVTNDVVKGQNTSAIYSEGYGWFPEDFVLVPGQGYKYQSKAVEDKTLTFVNSGHRAEPNRENCYWKGNEHAYAENMTVLATVYVADIEQHDSDLELGAFVNGVCRGSAKLKYFEPLNRYFAMLTISGDKAEDLEFALVNAEQNMMGNSSKEIITFAADAVIGSLDEPLEIHFGEMTEIDRNSLVIYPNPVDRNSSFTFDIPGSETISELLIVNSLGAEVMHQTGMTGKVVKGLPVSGIYSIQVITNTGNVYRGKLVVK